MAKRDYHEKLTEVRVRFPSEDEERGIPDYLAIMRNRAKELGYIQPKGITKGEGNVTEYIMKLVERDIQTVQPDFSFERSLINKKQD